MAEHSLNVLGLCSGALGLELGVSLATGGRSRLVAACERDPFATAVVVGRMAEQVVDPAPVWDDLTTFDGRPWRGVVDLVTAGFPCQPNSTAGKRLGTDDPRWLWPHVARVVREVGPDFVFLENVPGLLAERGGGRDVLRDLAEVGLDAEWSTLSAGASGATHERERLWILAYRHGCRLPIVGGEQLPDNGHPSRRHDADGSGREAVAHAHSSRGDQRPGPSHPAGPALEPADPGGRPAGDVADADREGRQGSDHRTPERWPRPPRDGSGLPLFPPGPDDHDAWRSVLDRAPCLEPSVRRVADGLAHRVDRIHTIGNGVVPLVAALALCGLARRAGCVENPMTLDNGQPIVTPESDQNGSEASHP